jgi:ferredoxin
MTVNQILCKGCGVCPSACPSAAITLRHYTSIQIDAQLDALLAKAGSSEQRAATEGEARVEPEKEKVGV